MYSYVPSLLSKNERTKFKKLTTLSGRIRHFTKGYAPLTKALNTPVQGTAADIIKRSLVDLAAELAATEAQIVACIHDEIILEVEEARAETAKQVLEQVMVAAGEHYRTQVPVVGLELIRRLAQKQQNDTNRAAKTLSGLGNQSASNAS